MCLTSQFRVRCQVQQSRDLTQENVLGTSQQRAPEGIVKSARPSGPSPRSLARRGFYDACSRASCRSEVQTWPSRRVFIDVAGRHRHCALKTRPGVSAPDDPRAGNRRGVSVTAKSGLARSGRHADTGRHRRRSTCNHLRSRPGAASTFDGQAFFPIAIPRRCSLMIASSASCAPARSSSSRWPRSATSASAITHG